MSDFSRNIEKLISINRIEQALEEFQNILSDFKSNSIQSQTESKELRNFLAGLSQRLYQAKDFQMKGSLSESEVTRERRNVSSVLLETTFDLDKYPEFNRFLNDREEEVDWKKAVASNSISVYREYFSKFPNGKYVQETKKLITELEHIEEEKALELKRKAEEEKRRREIEELRLKDESELYRREMEERRREDDERRSREDDERRRRDEEDRRRRDEERRRREQEQRIIDPQPNPVIPGPQPVAVKPGAVFNTALTIVLIIVTLFIPPLGVICGLYIRHSKEGDRLKFDDGSRTRGLILFIVGVALSFIYMLFYLQY